MSYDDRVAAERPSSLRDLVLLVAGLSVGGAVLAISAGPPHLPASWPTWTQVLHTLQGSEVPLAALAYAFSTAAWLLWLWLVVSLVLQVLVVLVETLARGAVWARQVRQLANRVTAPLVRRAVDGVLVAVVVVNLASRTVPAAAAAPPVAVSRVVEAHPLPAPGRVALSGLHMPQREARVQTRQDERVTAYTVKAADTLWTIAAQFYGTGEEYPRIVAANVGRLMPDGQRFPPTAVIRPGWVLQIPLPSRSVDERDGQQVYTVEPGDTLRGIAARFLGDEMRWPEIFRLNQGRARMPDGRTLTNPDLIWPGLELTLPQPPAAPPPPPAAPAPEHTPRSHSGAGTPQPPAVSVPPAPPVPVVPPAPTLQPVLSATPVPQPVLTAPSGMTPAVLPAAGAPSATAITVAAPAAGTGESFVDGVPLPLVVLAGGVALVASATLGAAALQQQRRRVRRSLSQPPPAPVQAVRTTGFLEAEITRSLAHRLHAVEPLPSMLVAQHAMRFLAAHRLNRSGILTTREQPHAVFLQWDAPLDEQERLVELAPEIGKLLGARATATISPAHDVELAVHGLNVANLAAPTVVLDLTPLRLVPLGVTPLRELTCVNWRAIGHMLIVSQPGGGADIVLTSLVCALAGRYTSQELQLWTLARPGVLPAALQQLPHQQGGDINPEQPGAIRAALQTIGAELDRRKQTLAPHATRLRPPDATTPDIVIIAGDLVDLQDEATIDQILTHGPAYGIQLLAATTQPQNLYDAVLEQISTRLVLRTQHDDQSLWQLGEAGAADLGLGELLARIDGRAAIRLRGFRVADAHLEQLVQLLQTPGSPAVPPARPAPAASAEQDTSMDAGAAAPHGGAPDGRTDAGPEAGNSPQLSEGGDGAGCAVQDAPPEPEVGEELEQGSDPGDHVNAPTGQAGSVPVQRVDINQDTGIVEDVPALNGPAAVPACQHTEAKPVQEDGDAPADGPGRVEGQVAPHPTAGGEPHASAASGCSHLAPSCDGGEERIVSGRGALLQMYCFGTFTLKHGDRTLSAAGEKGGASYKAKEMLAFLAAHPDGAVTSEKLESALWPEADSVAVSNNKRVTMKRLRDLLQQQVPELPNSIVSSGRDGMCRLDTCLVWSDVHAFVRLTTMAAKLPADQAKAALQHARCLYRGPLLTGADVDPYAWVQERDERGDALWEVYRNAYDRATYQLGQLYARDGQIAAAIDLYRSVLKNEPTLEDVARELYRCYRRTGDLAALKRDHLQLCQALRKVYADPTDPGADPADVQPEAETIAVYTAIKTELEAQAAALHGAEPDEAAPGLAPACGQPGGATGGVGP